MTTSQKIILLSPALSFIALLSLWILAPRIIGCSPDVHPFALMFFSGLVGGALIGTWCITAFSIHFALKLRKELASRTAAVASIAANGFYILTSAMAVNIQKWQLLC